MYEMIELKYGKKFLERIRNEAMEIYKPRRKEIIDEYHKEIEGGYVIVDSMPEYPEGIPELYKYVSLEMDKAGITEYKNAGKFFIQFVVEPDGTTTGFKSLKSPNPEVASILISILKTMPKWKSGVLNNEFVKVRMVLPFYNK